MEFPSKINLKWREGNGSTLLVGMQTGATTMENSLDFPQKTKEGTAFRFSDTMAGTIPWEFWITNSKEPMHPNVHSSIIYNSQVLETECPSVNEWIKKLVHLHNGILLIRKKEGTLKLHDSMGGTGEHYAKWYKPGSERQIPYDPTSKWNLITKQTNEQNRTSNLDIKNKLIVTREEVGGQ